MSMKDNGLNKLAEECSELAVVCAKFAAMEGQPIHFDGSNLRAAMIEEIADVLASIDFVVEKFGLSNNFIMPTDEMYPDTIKECIQKRRHRKRMQYAAWDRGEEHDG